MIKFQVFDAPIGHPDNDLFGMATYARKLAGFIDSVEPPFTIGIYGQWGDGKTSFVRLVNHYLAQSVRKEPIEFITFSAWPHTTSDAIWRALILRIAKDLYGIKDEATKSEDKQTVTDAGLRKRLIELLKKDAWTPWAPPPPVDPHADYFELISRLDKTAYGAISKNKADQLQLNEEAALMAIVKTGVTALGSLSPIIAGVRALFGLDAKLDVTRELNQGKSASARKLIESVDEFKLVLQELFENTARDKRVFVFIDDLDRCLPDAALDLLEATKIFFEGVGCIFIVAADETLIGQGLRLRFKDLLEANEESRMESLIAQKGKEYFEKIIQFPIRVPPRTTNQGHGFISAQFPQWTPATDIIQTALGINPRRLIQYCNLLSYKYEVYRIQTRPGLEGAKDVGPDESTPFEYLDKLMALYSWFPECLNALNQLLSEPNKYKKSIKDLEEWLSKSTEDTPLPDAEEQLKSCGCDELYRRSVALAPIFKLMRSEPLFSDAEPASLSTFLRMADIRPSIGKSMLTVRDSVFSRILSVVEEQGRTTAKQLLIDDITKLRTFDKSYPELTKSLFEIAKNESWMDQLRFIEDSLENPSEDPAAVKVSEAASKFSEDLKTAAAADSNLTALFLSTPRFSSITPREVLLYEQVRGQLQSARDSLNKNFESATGPDRYSRNAVAAIDQFPESERKEIEATLQLQADVAQYFLELRKFAKLDALAFKWPELADKLRADANSFMRTYETPANEQGPLPAGPIGSLFQHDTQLHKFLRLRPLFSGIVDRELNQYFAVAQVVVKATDIQQPVAAVTETPAPASSVIKTIPPVSYQNITLRMTIGPADKYQLIMKSGDSESQVDLDVDLKELADLSSRVQNLFLYRSGTRQLQRASFTQDPTSQLIEIGSLLYIKLLGAAPMAEEIFLKAIEDARRNNRKLRIILNLENGLPSLIPWEALYIPSLGLFPALTAQGFSMVRWLPDSTPLTPRMMRSPLRILVAISTPKDAPYLEVGREKTMLAELLDGPIKKNQVQLVVIEHATKDDLLRNFRNLRPHIFHFIGHGVLQRESSELGEGALVLESEEGITDLLSGQALRTIMGHDSSVSLAILNSCESGATAASDAISGVAQNLVMTGTPAVIATMRAILDQTALMFTREFYRSFVDGLPLEPSLIEARKSLSINQSDWAAYALFSGTTQLDDFKLVPS
jgi:Cdc6-like AAA superfamily ATPase